jgi:hypothetical protein
MPTGYTAGIIDGDITTFKQFATLCMRNFGATVHMRDDDMDAEYKPRVPSTYHAEAIEEAKLKLWDMENLTDEELIEQEIKSLNESKQYAVESIKKSKETRAKLEAMLEEVMKFKPPTPDHVGAWEFMIQQIKDTIQWDCDTKYSEESIVRAEVALESIDPDEIRGSVKANALEDIARHEKGLAEEIKRCNEANEWVKQFLKAIDDTNS